MKGLREQETQELRREFEGGENSFLGKSLAGTWDSPAFRQLCALLQTACVASENDSHVAKWMAAGFYDLDTNLDRYLPPLLGLEADFVDEVKEHFMFLACWFFSGVCPFESPQLLQAELEEILKKSPNSD